MRTYDEWLHEEMARPDRAVPSAETAETPEQKLARSLDRFTLAVATEREILAEVERTLAELGGAHEHTTERGSKRRRQGRGLQDLRDHWEWILGKHRVTLACLEEKLADLRAETSVKQ